MIPRRRSHQLLTAIRFNSPATVNSDNVLLSLPENVRFKIYAFLGVWDGRTYNLNRDYWYPENKERVYFVDEVCGIEGHSEAQRTATRNEINAAFPALGLPTSLLTVSRAVHDDFEAYLYRTGRFTVKAACPEGLWALENMSHHAVQHLRHLRVDLSLCICRNGWDIVTNPRGSRDVDIAGSRKHESAWCRSPWDFDRVGHDELIWAGDDRCRVMDRRILAEWEGACRHLASHSSRHLELFVEVSIADETIARKILAPLDGVGPIRLAGISFGLDCGEKHETLREMARQAVYRLQGQETVSAPFPFLDLPQELQLQLLKVAIEEDIVHCTYSRDRFQRCRILEGNVHTENFCKSQRPSLTAFSGTCVCGISPMSLFLVSKHVSGLALEVFYGPLPVLLSISKLKNADGSWVDPNDKLLLGGIRGGIPYLRSLKLRAPRLGADEYFSNMIQARRAGGQDLADWTGLMETLTTYDFQFDKLNLIIDLCGVGLPDRQPIPNFPDLHNDLGFNWFAQEVYYLFLAPLRRLACRGLVYESITLEADWPVEDGSAGWTTPWKINLVIDMARRTWTFLHAAPDETALLTAALSTFSMDRGPIAVEAATEAEDVTETGAGTEGDDATRAEKATE